MRLETVDRAIEGLGSMSMAEVDGKLRVLIVDDHKMLREGLVAYLDYDPGLLVVGEAGDGQQALDLARQLEPDVIVMDFSMPVMNGIEATRLIKQEMPNVRVVLLTMFEKAALARRAAEAGAEAFVAKGGSSQELLRAIRGDVAGG